MEERRAHGWTTIEQVSFRPRTSVQACCGALELTIHIGVRYTGVAQRKARIRKLPVNTFMSGVYGSQWQRSKSGQTDTVLGRNAGRQEQRHQEGRLHRAGASELALDVVRCCSITPRVPALPELRLRAPPRYATRWSTHEGFPVHYTRAGALWNNRHDQLGVLYNAHALEVSSVSLLPLSCCFGLRPDTQRE